MSEEPKDLFVSLRDVPLPEPYDARRRAYIEAFQTAVAAARRDPALVGKFIDGNECFSEKRIRYCIAIHRYGHRPKDRGGVLVSLAEHRARRNGA